jgi:hypothetical protein
MMPKKRFSSKQIVTKLRQIEGLLAQGKSVAAACKEADISEQSCVMNVWTRRSSTT